MGKLVFYHGTGRSFDRFRHDFATAGSCANSAFGIHLSECPALAAEYAELAMGDAGAGDPCVLEVEVDIERAVVISRYVDYMGYEADEPDQEIRTRADFSRLRDELAAAGFQAVVGDAGSGVDGQWIVFDPDRIIIRRRLSFERALEFEPAELNDDDVEYISLEAAASTSVLRP